jgi:hypothetical protein
MANKNTESTRYYSDAHEKSVCKALGARQQSNSGAGRYSKGDCVQEAASLLIECKTVMTDKESISIKKEWIAKNRDEAFAVRLQNSCIAFNFGPGQPNYYVINESLMQQLVEHLEESLK